MRVTWPQHHRMGQPTLLRQPVLRLRCQFLDRVPGEELRADPPFGGLLGDGLGAVLAELGQLASARLLGPRTSRTVEPVALVEPGQCRCRARGAHLLEPELQRHHHRLDARRLLFCAGDDHGVLVVVRVDVAVGVAAGGHGSNLCRDAHTRGERHGIHLEVYYGVMSRTNIDIDDELIATAMKMYRLDSKRSVVDLALRRLVGEPLSRNEVLAMQGTGFELTNDEIESFSIADLGPNDDS